MTSSHITSLQHCTVMYCSYSSSIHFCDNNFNARFNFQLTLGNKNFNASWLPRLSTYLIVYPVSKRIWVLHWCRCSSLLSGGLCNKKIERSYTTSQKVPLRASSRLSIQDSGAISKHFLFLLISTGTTNSTIIKQ